jgi:predicted nucleic acid-binding protein
VKIAFDTSVLVSALVEAHPHHDRAHIWLQSVVEDVSEGVLCLHALAETWSVLTRLPSKPRLSGRDALRIVERLQQSGFSTIDLPPALYDTALRRCADAGLSSGAVFDALHMVAAEAAGAELMLTFNVKHFQPLAREGSPRVLAPPDPPSLEVALPPSV